jgi:hypothetical protein
MITIAQVVTTTVAQTAMTIIRVCLSVDKFGFSCDIWVPFVSKSIGVGELEDLVGLPLAIVPYLFEMALTVW